MDVIVATLREIQYGPDGSLATDATRGARTSVFGVVADPSNPSATDGPTFVTYVQREYAAGRKIQFQNRTLIITAEDEVSGETSTPGALTLTANTSVPIIGTPTPCKGVLLFGHPANTGRIWFGLGASSIGAGGYISSGGVDGGYLLPVSDASNIFVTAEVTSDKVTFLPLH